MYLYIFLFFSLVLVNRLIWSLAYSISFLHIDTFYKDFIEEEKDVLKKRKELVEKARENRKELKEKIQNYLDSGCTYAYIADELAIPVSTIRNIMKYHD